MAPGQAYPITFWILGQYANSCAATDSLDSGESPSQSMC
jgi:hypothetical protein